MEWPVFFSELANFLPKRIPMYPSYRIGMVTFSVVLMASLWIYKQDDERRRKLGTTVPIEVLTFGKFIYVCCVLGLSFTCAKVAFKQQFYLDNWKTNGKWMVYKTWFLD